jgi:putative membrane protein
VAHFLVRLAVAWGLNVAALLVADWLFDSVTIEDNASLIIAGAVLGLTSAILKPILKLVTLPLILLTFGLFIIVINMAILGITDWLVDGFDIEGFWTYVGTALVIGIVNTVLGWLLPDSMDRRD